MNHQRRQTGGSTRNAARAGCGLRSPAADTARTSNAYVPGARFENITDLNGLGALQSSLAPTNRYSNDTVSPGAKLMPKNAISSCDRPGVSSRPAGLSSPAGETG